MLPQSYSPPPPPPKKKKKKTPTLCRYVMSKVGSRIFICGGGGGWGAKYYYECELCFLCSLMLSGPYFSNSDTKWDIKNSRSIFFFFSFSFFPLFTFLFFLGGGGLPAVPPLDPPLIRQAEAVTRKRVFPTHTPTHQLALYHWCGLLLFFFNKTIHLWYSWSFVNCLL